jgi:hypothetical protein
MSGDKTRTAPSQVLDIAQHALYHSPHEYLHAMIMP